MVFAGRSEAIPFERKIALLRASQPQTTLLAMTAPKLKRTPSQPDFSRFDKRPQL